MSYRTMIQSIAPNCDPRHIEGFMRSWHGTLDALSRDHFEAEALAAVQCVETGGVAVAESVALTHGL